MLHQRKCTPLPMPQEVFDRTHTIAERQKTPSGLEFLRRNGTQFEDVIDGPVSPTEDVNKSDEEDDGTVIDAERDGVDMGSVDGKTGENATNEDHISNDEDSMHTESSNERDEVQIHDAEEAPNAPELAIDEDDLTDNEQHPPPEISDNMGTEVTTNNILPDGQSRR